jgi:hypothetical protein
MLLLSVMLRLTEGHHQRGFTLPLQLVVGRNAHTWTPWVEEWSDEMWNYVAAYVTRIWRSLHCVAISSKDLKEEMLVVVGGLKLISSGEETSERYRGNGKLTWDSKWRLLCLSVAVESNEANLAPHLGEGVDLTQVTDWLNRSPLFVSSPISKHEIVVALRLLQQLLCPRTLAVPSIPTKRPSTESLSSKVKRNR